MSAMSTVLTVLLVTVAVSGAPKRGASQQARESALAVLSSLDSAALQDIKLENRMLRVTLNAFSGQVDIYGGTVRGVVCCERYNVTVVNRRNVIASVAAKRLDLHYAANVSFYGRSEPAEMDVSVDSMSLTTEFEWSGDEVDLVSVEAEDMSDLKVSLRGLKMFRANADLLALLFRSNYYFDIQDEVAEHFAAVLRDLVYAFNANKP